MNRMPAGSYLPGDSAIHQVNPTIKLLCLLILLAAIVMTNSVLGFCFTAAVTLGTIWQSNIGISVTIRSIARLWLFFLVILGMNAFFFDSEQILWAWWIFHLSIGGIIQGTTVILRVILLMMLCSVFTSTTPPVEITGAIETLILPLKCIRVPTGDVAMILGVSIQFIPTLLEETEMIKKAQIARGAQFESSRLRDRAASLAPLIIPIFLSAFRRADDLAIAMEARGYRRAKGRTKRTNRPFRKRDAAALTVSCLLCVIQIFLNNRP